MLRSILAVVGGYAVLSVCSMILLTAYYLIVGTEGAFEPASYETTPLWYTGMIVLGLISVFVGGYTCAAIARNTTAPTILAGILFILYIVSAIYYVPDGVGLVREGAVSVWDARTYAIEPAWLTWLWPVLAAGAVLIAASRYRGGGAAPAATDDPASEEPPAETGTAGSEAVGGRQIDDPI